MRSAGLVLAGGLGSRMGASEPKPLLAVGDRTSLSRALDCLRPACAPLLVSANDPRIAPVGILVLADRRADRLGPLAALEAAFHYLSASDAPPTHLVTVPGDTPFLPLDLVERLGTGGRPRIASFAGRTHPTVASWPVELLSPLTAELDRPDGNRSMRWILDRTGVDEIDFTTEPAAPGGDPFFNVNTPADLAEARRTLGDSPITPRPV